MKALIYIASFYLIIIGLVSTCVCKLSNKGCCSKCCLGLYAVFAKGTIVLALLFSIPAMTIYHYSEQDIVRGCNHAMKAQVDETILTKYKPQEQLFIKTMNKIDMNLAKVSAASMCKKACPCAPIPEGTPGYDP